MQNWKEKCRDSTSTFTKWDLTICCLQDIYNHWARQNSPCTQLPKTSFLSISGFVTFNWNVANYCLRDQRRYVFLLWLRPMNYNVTTLGITLWITVWITLCRLSGKKSILYHWAAWKIWNHKQMTWYLICIRSRCICPLAYWIFSMSKSYSLSLFTVLR